MELPIERRRANCAAQVPELEAKEPLHRGMEGSAKFQFACRAPHAVAQRAGRRLPGAHDARLQELQIVDFCGIALLWSLTSAVLALLCCPGEEWIYWPKASAPEGSERLLRISWELGTGAQVGAGPKSSRS